MLTTHNDRCHGISYPHTFWVCIGILLFMPFISLAQSISRLYCIDFEGFDEGTPISDQYASIGVHFSLPNNPSLYPIIALEGNPIVAFDGTEGGDQPIISGTACLTDPLVDGSFALGNDIAVDFDPPITSVHLFIIDIDVGETVTLHAFNGSNPISSVTHASGDPETRNNGTIFFIQAPAISRIVLDVPDVCAFGFDLLTFIRSYENAPCGLAIEIAQETIPGTGDFDEHVLGHLLPFQTAYSAANMYFYNFPLRDSWNGQILDPVVGRSHLFFANTTDGLTLGIVHDRPDNPAGGKAEMKFELFNDPDGMQRTVEDDPQADEEGSGYTGNSGDSLFTTAQDWNACCTDGVTFSGLDYQWELLLQFAEVDDKPKSKPIVGFTEWVAYSADGSQIPLVLQENRRVRLRIVQQGFPVELSQESQPQLGDFDQHVLGQLQAFIAPSDAAAFYAYDTPNGSSWNGKALDPVADRSHLLMADTTEGLTLVVVHDRPGNPDGGQAEMKFEVLNDPSGMRITVRDDPDDTGAGYTGDPGDSLFTAALEWIESATDGVALSGLDQGGSLLVQFTEVDQNPDTPPIRSLTEWIAYSADGTEFPLVLQKDRRVRLRTTKPCLICDLDSDGIVNLEDLSILCGQWLTTSCSYPSHCNGTDLTFDLQVDLHDFVLCASQWLKGS